MNFRAPTTLSFTIASSLALASACSSDDTAYGSTGGATTDAATTGMDDETQGQSSTSAASTSGESESTGAEEDLLTCANRAPDTCQWDAQLAQNVIRVTCYDDNLNHDKVGYNPNKHGMTLRAAVEDHLDSSRPGVVELCEAGKTLPMTEGSIHAATSFSFNGHVAGSPLYTTLDAGQQSSFFYIANPNATTENPQNVFLSGLRFVNGHSMGLDEASVLTLGDHDAMIPPESIRVQVTDSVMDHNIGDNSAIVVSPEAYLLLDRVEMTRNQTTDSGGSVLLRGKADVMNSSFVASVAALFGGAFFVEQYEDVPPQLKIWNSTFGDNRARFGAAIAGTAGHIILGFNDAAHNISVAEPESEVERAAFDFWSGTDGVTVELIGNKIANNYKAHGELPAYNFAIGEHTTVISHGGNILGRVEEDDMPFLHPTDQSINDVFKGAHAVEHMQTGGELLYYRVPRNWDGQDNGSTLVFKPMPIAHDVIPLELCTRFFSKLAMLDARGKIRPGGFAFNTDACDPGAVELQGDDPINNISGQFLWELFP